MTKRLLVIARRAAQSRERPGAARRAERRVSAGRPAA